MADVSDEEDAKLDEAEEKEEKTEQIDTSWAHMRKRLVEGCERYTSALKKRKLNGSEAAIERSLAKMVKSICRYTTPEQEPSSANAAALRRAVAHGEFGMRATIKRNADHLQDFLHPAVKRCLLEADLLLTAEEQNLFSSVNQALKAQKLYSEKPVNKRVFLSNLERLLTLHRQVKPESAASVTCATAGNLPLNVAAKFCLCSNLSAESQLRVQLLLHSGLQYALSDLEEAIQQYAKFKQTWQALRDQCPGGKKKQWKMDEFFATIEKIGDPEVAADRHSKEEIREVLVNAGMGKNRLLQLYCAGFKNLGREDLVAFLLETENTRLTNITAAMRLCKLSKWHKQLHDELVAKEKNNRNTAYPEEHVQKQSKMFSAFVLALNQYAESQTWVSSTIHECKLQVFFRDATLAQLEEAVREGLRARLVDNNRVKSCHMTHSATPHANLTLRFLKSTLRKHLGCRSELSQLTVKSLLQDVENKRNPADPLKRRTYSEQEMAAMLAAVTNPAEAVLMTILEEIGLRISAISKLTYATLFTSTHTPRTTCKVKEKGNQWRIFEVSATLHGRLKALSDFLRAHHKDEDVCNCFPLNLANIRKPWHTTCISNTLHRIANDAHITDVSVHAHSFRHTLVSRLMKAGNSLEVASKYIGHSNVSTTNYFYWLPSPEELQKQIINPFSASYHEQRMIEQDATLFLETANAKVRACRRIIDTMLQEADLDTKTKVLHKIPNLLELLESVDVPVGCTSKVSSVSNDEKAAREDDFS